MPMPRAVDTFGTALGVFIPKLLEVQPRHLIVELLAAGAYRRKGNGEAPACDCYFFEQRIGIEMEPALTITTLSRGLRAIKTSSRPSTL